MKTKCFAFAVILMLIASMAFSQATTNPGTFRGPTVRTGTTTTSIYWNAGTINNGGHAVAVAAGSAALGASKVDCSAPAYGSCDILYFGPTGTGAVTTDIFTAAGAGNTIAAFIETTAGSVPSSIVMPQQSSVAANAAAGMFSSQTLTANPTSPSSQRLIRAEYTLPAAMTAGTLTAIRGAITAPTGGTVAGSFLFGVQGKITTGTATISGTSSAAVYAQYDVTGGTISAGNHAAIQANFVGVAAPTTFPIDGIYVEQAGGGRVHSYLRGLGNVEYIFDVSGSAFSDATSGTAASCTVGWIRVMVEGVARKIQLCAD